MLVTNPNEIAAIADAIASARSVAFDLEFAAADRLTPRLCLVQVAWLPPSVSLAAPVDDVLAAAPEIRLVDPIAGDVTPIITALAAHSCVIAHAPRQDLAILHARFGIVMPGLIDTQLMAAFVGLGEQIGLAALANELLGTRLGKQQQWTAWERRPLTDAQLAYAASDVRHLHALYASLAARLGPRIDWARIETAAIVADAVAAASVTPDTAWQQLGIRGAGPAEHGVLVAIAAWRHRVAVEFDRPLGHVLADKSIVELARLRPVDAAAIRRIKGMPELARQRAEELAALISSAPPSSASVTSVRGLSQPAQRWAEGLLAIAHVISEQTQIAARLLATRADAEVFARRFDEGGIAATTELPAQTTWRRELLGTAWEGWLRGELAMVATANGIELRAQFGPRDSFSPSGRSAQ